MAITFQKQPLNFFNVNEPAIFEFTSNKDLGVNPNDLVADLQIKSLYSIRSYTIKNILPKYGAGVFRVDVSGYLKSLMLDNFNYQFNSSNRRLTIERFNIGVAVHAENASDIFGDEYVFESGYIFDTTFVFAEGARTDSATNDGFYPTIGISQISEPVKAQKDLTRLSLLSPKYAEFAQGFDNTISVFVGQLVSKGGFNVIVDGTTSSAAPIVGVATAPITSSQIAKMYLPTLIKTTLNNSAIPVYGVSYKGDNCEETLQFRFYNSYGGYSYFYTPKEALTASRSKTEFINNAFYNPQDGQSLRVQKSADYKENLALSGIKALELKELFLELLRSPKVEVLLPRGFTECEVSGNLNLRKLDFEYALNVDIANVAQMEL